MGYEIKYFYKEADETPGTYKEEVLSRTSKLGKFDEEIPIEQVAGKIMAQLARRNVLIVDIEIYEYAKNKIKYKETENGIFIKNKKFSFDSGASISAESYEDEELVRILEDKNLLEKIKKSIGITQEKQLGTMMSVPKISTNKKALRLEIYDPEVPARHKVEQKGYKLTLGKKYPIYEEKSMGAGLLIYVTKDDRGREAEISAECFIAPPMGLSHNSDEYQYVGAEKEKKDVDLWRNQSTEQSMPDIRSK
jgi:hypothetical protein